MLRFGFVKAQFAQLGLQVLNHLSVLLGHLRQDVLFSEHLPLPCLDAFQQKKNEDDLKKNEKNEDNLKKIIKKMKTTSKKISFLDSS